MMILNRYGIEKNVNTMRDGEQSMDMLANNEWIL